jgi:hypothetical protein
LKETALYYPVLELFNNLGFTVKGEVGKIDLMAVKDSLTVAVELKLRPSLKLIYQALDRQKHCDIVYVAIPENTLKKRSSGYRSFIQLLERLDLGLILVGDSVATIDRDLASINPEKSKKPTKRGKEKMIETFLERRFDINVGGSQKSTMTNYKEKVVIVAKTIKEKKIATPQEIRVLTGIKESSAILSRNYYGWFERIEKGLYRLSVKGEIEVASTLEMIDL